MKTLDRFLKYVSVDTQSDPDAECFPSTAKQKVLLEMLKNELIEIGVSNVRMDENGYVYASIPANCEGKPAIGFLSHADTSSAVSGESVKPSIIRYEGGDIVLNKEKNIVMKAETYTSLADNIGKELIVTDGTTLLGADDKAGVAEIMTMAEFFLNNPDVKHGEILIAFTPDEEVGRGVEFFDMNEFKADFAYTVDGGALGEIEYENFNAAAMTITAHGVSIHPGSAKDMMINAVEVLMDFHSLLPVQMRPQYTENYEGFYHLDKISGSVQEAKSDYIIRDHDKTKFEEKKAYALKAAELINAKYGEGVLEIKLKDSYYNMREYVEKHMELIRNAEKAMENLGVQPVVVPIRGGTDGAQLTYRGLVCPNLCAGGYNFHGIYEYIPVESLDRIAEILIEIVKIFAE